MTVEEICHYKPGGVHKGKDMIGNTAIMFMWVVDQKLHDGDSGLFHPLTKQWLKPIRCFLVPEADMRRRGFLSVLGGAGSERRCRSLAFS
jgi:hypothetical protein